MNNLVTSSYYDLAPTTKASAEGIVSSVLSALPMAITRPLLEYRRLNAQVDVIMRAIEANEKTREDIMKTIRELGAAGQLTPELAQYLLRRTIRHSFNYRFSQTHLRTGHSQSKLLCPVLFGFCQR